MKLILTSENRLRAHANETDERQLETSSFPPPNELAEISTRLF
jgi:hypothetical protein